MKTISKLVCVVIAAAFPLIASASVETLSFSCSSHLVVSQDNGYQASCDGDFSFDSGTLIDDTSIRLIALGALNIHSGVSLIAPLIELSGSSVFIDTGVLLDAGYVGSPINTTEVKLRYVFEPKKPLILSQVPEPSNLNMLAMGLFCLGLVVRRKSK